MSDLKICKECGKEYDPAEKDYGNMPLQLQTYHQEKSTFCSMKCNKRYNYRVFYRKNRRYNIERVKDWQKKQK